MFVWNHDRPQLGKKKAQILFLLTWKTHGTGLTSISFCREGKICINRVPCEGVNSGRVQEFVGHHSRRRTYQLKVQCSKILNVCTMVFSVGQIPTCSGPELFYEFYIYIYMYVYITDATEPSVPAWRSALYFSQRGFLKKRRGNYIYCLLFCVHVVPNYSLYYADNTVLITNIWMCVSWEIISNWKWKADWCSSLLFVCRSIPQLDN